VDGKCERCKTEIIQKKTPQWFIKITAYADRLIQDLDLLDRPEETKTAQKHRIGKSEGTEIDFTCDTITLTAFTTRIDTVYGVSALVIAPEHTILDHLIPTDLHDAVKIYRQTVMAKTSVQRQQDAKDKTGIFS
jgi:leucyl-tRNA synthetase